MKVVAYYPGYNPEHRIVLEALAEGIPGAITRPVTKYEPCDVAIVFGGVKYAYPPTHTKAPILDRHKGRHLIMVEAGFVKRGEYWAIGWGGQAGHADFNHGDMIRYDRVSNIIAPALDAWHHRPAGPVVVCGQLPRDVQVQDIDHRGWCRETVAMYHRAGVKVRFRPHPMINSPNDYGVPERFIDMRPLADVLRLARCFVTWNSTSAVDAVLAGVPVVALDPGSIAYPVASHDLENLAHMPERSEWIAKLGFSQWTLEEMRAGLPWQYLTRNISHAIR